MVQTIALKAPSLFAYCSIPLQLPLTYVHNSTVLQFMWTGWLDDWKGIMGSWPMVEREHVLSRTSFLAFSLVAQPHKMSCQTACITIDCHSVIVLMQSSVCIDLTVTQMLSKSSTLKTAGCLVMTHRVIQVLFSCLPENWWLCQGSCYSTQVNVVCSRRANKSPPLFSP